MKVGQAKRRKALEAEHARRRRAVADLTVDKLLLKDVAEGQILSPARRRIAVSHVRSNRGDSERRVCRALGMSRSVGPIHAATERRRSGVNALDCGVSGAVWPSRIAARPRPAAGARLAGQSMLGVMRLWRREGLKVPAKQPKRGRLWLNDGS